ncbi:MAG TPA: hypothetical protein VFC16_13350 [Nakamurella sp.]|nr:hypothetical protein [Nakamurella sp.]
MVDRRGRGPAAGGGVHRELGEAGAIDRYGPALGLPIGYSGHTFFHDWGPPADTATGPVLLVHPAA